MNSKRALPFALAGLLALVPSPAGAGAGDSLPPDEVFLPAIEIDPRDYAAGNGITVSDSCWGEGPCARVSNGFIQYRFTVAGNQPSFGVDFLDVYLRGHSTGSNGYCQTTLEHPGKVWWNRVNPCPNSGNGWTHYIQIFGAGQIQPTEVVGEYTLTFRCLTGGSCMFDIQGIRIETGYAGLSLSVWGVENNYDFSRVIGPNGQISPPRTPAPSTNPDGLRPQTCAKFTGGGFPHSYWYDRYELTLDWGDGTVDGPFPLAQTESKRLCHNYAWPLSSYNLYATLTDNFYPERRFDELNVQVPGGVKLFNN